MTKEIEDGGAAFPREDYQTDGARGQRGMSLRDYLAAAALPAILADALANDETISDGSAVLRAVAKASYLVADAMLKARKEPSNG